MASVTDYGATGQPLNSPPLGGPTGWAAAVAAALDSDDTTVDARIAAALTVSNGGVSVKDPAHGAVGDGTTDDGDAIRSAITAAGEGGVVIFPPSSGAYIVSSALTPKERQIWVGYHSPKYEWDETISYLPGAIKAAASFTSGALITHSTADGTGSRGVTLRNLAFIGSGESNTLNAIDLGAASGGERAWNIESCQFTLFGGAAIAGHAWVLDVRHCHVSRCGYAWRPSSGSAGTAATAFDCRVSFNQFYFNYHGGVYFDGSTEVGQINLTGNRIERSGTQVSGGTVDPNSNRDEDAAGIYITRCTVVQLIGNSTDANAGPGLQLEGASSNLVNNVSSVGNIWKRDGTGDNSTTNVAGVRVKNGQRISFHGDRITYGDPNDGGSGRIAPQYGLEFESTNYSHFDGHIELESGALTVSNGFHDVSGNSDNVIRENGRMRLFGIPRGTTTNRPSPPSSSAALYYDTTVGGLVAWDGSSWAAV